MIVVLMMGGEPNPALMRNSIHAVVMLVLHGLAGLCIVVCAIYHREPEFHVAGANAFLSVLIPMAVLVLVMPNFVAPRRDPLLQRAARVRFGRVPRALRGLPLHPDGLASGLFPADRRR